MKLGLVMMGMVVVLAAAWPSIAAAPQLAIIIDSGSPYFVPKSATVSTGAAIRWENPTPTEHTITHTDCLDDANSCAFDSGIVLPNSSFVLPGLPPGRYPYLCRIHPIMHGMIIVTDSAPLPSQL